MSIHWPILNDVYSVRNGPTDAGPPLATMSGDRKGGWTLSAAGPNKQSLPTLSR